MEQVPFARVHWSGRLIADQVRAARIALGWTQSELADRAEVGLRTIRRIEAGDAMTPVIANAVRAALREAGIVLFADPAELEGVDLAFGIAVLKGAVIGHSRG